MSTLQTQRQSYFDALYASNIDPYGLRDRWYELRKRAALLASLPRTRYRNGFEPACGIGELTIELASRCERLLATDFNASAVATASQRTAHLGNVRIERQVLPGNFPSGDAGPFDLIVLSEIGYFLSEQEMRHVATWCARVLSADGTLVACHWRWNFASRTLTTPDVHALLGETLCTLVTHTEADYLLQVWTHDGRSVGQQAGIA